MSVTIKPGWTPDRTEILTRNAREGKSAREIGEMLGITRNAVIGKLMRMGITNSADRQRETWRQTAALSQRAERREKPAPKALVAAREGAVVALPALGSRRPIPASLVALEALEARQCRWPYGDPGEPGFGFCGQRTAKGSIYCPSCRRVAYQPKKADQPKTKPTDPARWLIQAVRRFG